MLERQSKTHEDAVKEYKRRYGRKPPKGFDHWWDACRTTEMGLMFRDRFEWATEKGLKLVDGEDQISRSLALTSGRVRQSV